MNQMKVPRLFYNLNNENVHILYNKIIFSIEFNEGIQQYDRTDVSKILYEEKQQQQQLQQQGKYVPIAPPRRQNLQYQKQQEQQQQQRQLNLSSNTLSSGIESAITHSGSDSFKTNQGLYLYAYALKYF